MPRTNFNGWGEDLSSPYDRLVRLGWLSLPRDSGPIQTTIVRFLVHHDKLLNGRPVRPGTIAEIEQDDAERLFGFRPFGFQKEGAQLESATVDQLRAYESLMKEVDENEEVTANDPLSQQLGMVSPETPKLIVRFLRHGCASDKRSCNPGEVWPVEKELAVRHLLEKKPVVELASPEELKRDRDRVNRISETKNRWDQLGITDEASRRFVVRYLKSGTHTKGHTCEPREVWEVDEDHAHSLCRGSSPVCELATEAELKAYRNRLIEASEPVVLTTSVDIDRLSTGRNESPIRPFDGNERKASHQGSEIRPDIVTTPYGLQYSVVDWLNGLNPGPFGVFWDPLYFTLQELSLLIPECELSADTYNDILDAFCVLNFGQIGYSRSVSDLIVVAMKLPTSTTAHDEALRMIRGLWDDLQVKGYGPQDTPWAYTEWDMRQTQQRWRNRPDAELLWKRKTELVSREVFQSRIRSHGLPGGKQKWSDSALEDLKNRIDVEECHLKTYLKSMPPAQAVALLSHQTIPGESASSGALTKVPQSVSQVKETASDDRTGGKPTTLRPCDKKAWSQFERAQEAKPDLKTDREVYDWYLENMADEKNELPSFATWAKYVRKVRAAEDRRKNKIGVAHETRSVVPAKRL